MLAFFGPGDEKVHFAQNDFSENYFKIIKNDSVYKQMGEGVGKGVKSQNYAKNCNSAKMIFLWNFAF